MVEGVLTFAAEGVLMKLSSLAAQEITLSWGFKGELNRLRRTLSTIEGYLGDVTDQPQDRGDSIEDWVKNLKGIAQDADDVLDEINYELLRHKVELQNHIKKKELWIWDCGNLTSIRITHGMALTSLRELEIGYCNEISSLPALQQCRSLQKLEVSFCPKLTSISSISLHEHEHNHEFDSALPANVSISDENLLLSRSCSNLEQLSITYCHGLQSIPELQNFTSLRQLSIQNCERLERLLCSGLLMPISLVELKICCAPNLEALPSLDNLTCLSKLEINCCGKLKCLPIGPHCSTSLKVLKLGGLNLDSFPDFQVGSSQLETLILRGWPKLKSLPQQIQNFTSLTYLSIQCFHGVEALPEWLGNLTSLTKLEILNFKNMMYLPSVTAIQRLTKLKTLELCGCPLLQSKEWPKISHIQHIDGFNQHWLYYGLLLKPS